MPEKLELARRAEGDAITYIWRARKSQDIRVIEPIVISLCLSRTHPRPEVLTRQPSKHHRSMAAAARNFFRPLIPIHCRYRALAPLSKPASPNQGLPGPLNRVWQSSSSSLLPESACARSLLRRGRRACQAYAVGPWPRAARSWGRLGFGMGVHFWCRGVSIEHQFGNPRPRCPVSAVQDPWQKSHCRKPARVCGSVEVAAHGHQ
jgi:hypothetical protein